MRSASFYRVSGNTLIVAALLWAISLLIQPHGPANTVAEMMAQVGPLWILSTMIGIVGTVLGIAAIIGLYRHFVGGDLEGWALLGAACAITGAILMIACMAIGGASLPIVLRMVADARLVAPEPIETALILALSGLGIVGGTLMWLGLVPLGFSMLRDAVWPRTVAWGAMAIGVIEVIASFLFMRDEMVSLFFSIVGFAFLALVGNTLARIPRHMEKAAPVEQPGAVV